MGTFKKVINYNFSIVCFYLNFLHRKRPDFGAGAGAADYDYDHEDDIPLGVPVGNEEYSDTSSDNDAEDDAEAEVLLDALFDETPAQFRYDDWYEEVENYSVASLPHTHFDELWLQKFCIDHDIGREGQLELMEWSERVSHLFSFGFVLFSYCKCYEA